MPSAANEWPRGVAFRGTKIQTVMLRDGEVAASPSQQPGRDRPPSRRRRVAGGERRAGFGERADLGPLVSDDLGEV
jgi:hypothetical protein